MLQNGARDVNYRWTAISDRRQDTFALRILPPHEPRAKTGIGIRATIASLEGAATQAGEFSTF